MSFATNGTTFRAVRFGRNSDVYQGTALTLDDIRRAAPSAFAASAHESRSTRFTHIPTSAVIEALMREGFQPFKVVQAKSRIEGKGDFTKHMIRFRYQGAETNLDSATEVIVINANDGTSSYYLFGGLFRFVCENGLIVADSVIGSLKVSHKGNVVDQVIDGSFKIVRQSGRALEISQQWSQLQLTGGEQRAFAEAAHQLRFEPEVNAAGEELPVTAHPIQPTKLLEARRYDDAGNDLWSTFNRLQENIIQGGVKGSRYDADARKTRRVSTRGVKGIDGDVKLNRSLWTLGERMAELKGAA